MSIHSIMNHNPSVFVTNSTHKGGGFLTVKYDPVDDVYNNLGAIDLENGNIWKIKRTGWLHKIPGRGNTTLRDKPINFGIISLLI
jgi:hypothetical protein